MTIAKTLVLLVLNTGIVLGQPINRQIYYYQKVLDFYSFLEKEEVSISDAYNVFSNYTYEVEENLFFNRCLVSKNEHECISIFEKKILTPKSSNSLLFEALRKKKDMFFQVEKDSINEVINNSTIINEGNPSSVSLNLLFPNGNMIYFKLNKYCDEPVYIQDVIIWTGESIFNLICNPE
jgi:hypothetical protein